MPKEEKKRKDYSFLLPIFFIVILICGLLGAIAYAKDIVESKSETVIEEYVTQSVEYTMQGSGRTEGSKAGEAFRIAYDNALAKIKEQTGYLSDNTTWRISKVYEKSCLFDEELNQTTSVVEVSIMVDKRRDE